MSQSLCEHYIQWLRSETTQRRFPKVVFVADTDVATMDWFGLTSTVRMEVVIASWKGPEDAEKANVESRANSVLGRDDLRIVHVSRSVDMNTGLAGLPFTEFRRRYRRPATFYRDIFSNGEAVEEEENTPLGI